MHVVQTQRAFNLPEHLQPKLNFSSPPRSQHTSEVDGGNVAIRVEELCVVPGIEEFRSELHP